MPRFVGLTLLLLAFSSTTAVPVRAADPGFCQGYAHRAVAQFRQAKSLPGCMPRATRRWHPEFALHFGWCVSARPAVVDAEDSYRVVRLSECRRRAP